MTTNDQLLLKKCLKEIEQKLNWIDSAQWQQTYFESLNELIFDKTKVSLSPLTLKRLWGKSKYNSNPSASTLDTLARFLEYNSWVDYQSSHKKRSISFRIHLSKYKRAVLLAAIFVGVPLLALVFIKGRSHSVVKDYSDAEFSVQQLSKGFPNTVYFKYNAKNTDADSVIIQQSWDPALSHQVDKEKTDFSCIYYYPGYYKAKLILDNQIVSQSDLYLKSEGWLGIIHKDPVPVYIDYDNLADESVLSIKEEQLIAAGFDLKNTIPMSTINLVEDFDSIMGNNFELQASFKQTFAEGEAICQKTGVMILCSDGYYYLPFSIKGCVNELNMFIPDKMISATETDLRNLGFENSAIVNLKINVTDGAFQVQINNNEAIRDTLTTNPGKIVGVKFGFHGTGELYSFNLSSGQKAYAMRDFEP